MTKKITESRKEEIRLLAQRNIRDFIQQLNDRYCPRCKNYINPAKEHGRVPMRYRVVYERSSPLI